MPPPLPLSSTSEELRKRLRAREYVRRTYAKKKNTLASLREQLTGLEQQYEALLQSHPPGEEGSDSATRLAKYQQLTQLKHDLYAENEALQAVATDHMINEARLQQVVDVDGDLPISGMPFHFRPLPMEVYQREILACRDDAIEFVSDPQRKSSGLKVFGWTDQRNVTSETLAFALEKEFQMPAIELVNRTWAMLVNPATNRLMYSSSMNPVVHTLQHVDANTVLFYWRLSPVGFPLIFKSVFLLSRIPFPGGYMLAIRSIDRHAIHFDDDGINEVILEARERRETNDGSTASKDRPVHWAIMNNWMVVQEIAPSVCKYHFGGLSKASLWELEVLLMCLRWENLVLGSRLLPPAT